MPSPRPPRADRQGPPASPLLAMVAAVTGRLRAGTFVLNACLRHPAVLARDLATLDALSGGRLETGPGAGWNGGGKRLLTLAARQAQVIGLAPRLVQGGRPASTPGP